MVENHTARHRSQPARGMLESYRRFPVRARPFGAAWALLIAALLYASTCVGAASGNSTVLVVGDSLSAGYGLAASEGWVSLLAKKLAPRGIEVVNASISGETTAGGAARIERELARVKPAWVIIELGANDGLRGSSLDAMRANLQRMIEASQRADARVLLVGIRIPPNYGPDYTERFHAIYGELAKKYDTAYLPFLLEPIAFDRAAFQADRLHPTAAVQPALLDHVWTALGPMLVAERVQP